MDICDSYTETHFKAFREAFAIQGMREGRIEPRGRPYELLRVEADGDTATAVFSGYPYFPLAGATPEQHAYGAVRMVKTYILKKGESRIGVELEAVNESAQSLPVALWVLNGLRIEGEDAEVFGPAPAGTLARPDPWSKGSSTFLMIPEAAGAWTAAVGQDPARTGMILAGDPARLEAIYNWLAKFTGFTLGFGATREELSPGATFKMRYDLLFTRDMPRVDAATADVAAGLAFPSVPSNGLLPVTVWVLSPRDDEADVSLSLRKPSSGEWSVLGQTSGPLKAGQGRPFQFQASLGGDGLYVLKADIRTASGVALNAERPITLGLTADVYAAPRRRLAGTPCWAFDLGERPLPDWVQECDRLARFPQVPWNAPTSLKPLRVLFSSRRRHTR